MFRPTALQPLPSSADLLGSDTIVFQDVSFAYRLQPNQQHGLKEFVSQPVKRLFKRNEPQNTFYALRNLSFRIAPGSIVGIIGPNGAGKSTTLRLIAGTQLPTHGRIVSRGSITPLLSKGMGSNNELTGRENIFLLAAMLGWSRAEIAERIDELAQWADLEEFIDMPMRTYSSGMRARLMFSVSTARTHETDILLLDESFSVGDADFREKSLERINQFQKLGQTTVIASHSMSIVEAYCSTVIWLEKGRIAQIGPTEEVLDVYKNFRRKIQREKMGLSTS